MILKELLTTLTELNFVEVVDYYVEAKTKNSISALDVFPVDTISQINELGEHIDELIKKYNK